MKEVVAIVDDIYANRFLMEKSLSEYEVHAFAEGDSFYEYLKKNIPDLVIMDVGLPGEDGFRIAKKMRQDTRLSDIPVIFVTAHSSTKDILEGVKSGGYDYISKPFDDAVLIDRVQSVLSKKNKERISRSKKAES